MIVMMRMIFYKFDDFVKFDNFDKFDNHDEFWWFWWLQYYDHFVDAQQAQKNMMWQQQVTMILMIVIFCFGKIPWNDGNDH